MKYITILAVFAVMFNYPYGEEILASIISLFAAVYYYLAFKLTAGLNSSEIVADDLDDTQQTTLAVFSNATAVATLILQTNYAYIGIVALPMIAITFATMIMSWLIYFEIIEITPSEDENEEEL